MNDKEVSEYLELIEKLRKEKKGNPNDLDNYKQILIEDRKLHESNLNYLKRLDGQIVSKQDESKQDESKQDQSKQDRPLITTTESIQGKIIEEYMGIVSGHAVLGMNFFTDLIGGFRDLIGGRSETLESYFLDAREIALDEMVEEALDYGANAIVAVRFNDVSMEGKNRQMALVTVHGTAVKIVKEKKEVKTSKKN